MVALGIAQANLPGGYNNERNSFDFGVRPVNAGVSLKVSIDEVREYIVYREMYFLFPSKLQLGMELVSVFMSERLSVHDTGERSPVLWPERLSVVSVTGILLSCPP